MYANIRRQMYSIGGQLHVNAIDFIDVLTCKYPIVQPIQYDVI